MASLTHGPPVDVRIPGDKSLSHRALMFAALGGGTSRIAGLLDSADVRSTAECLRRLGVSVPPTDAPLRIESRGALELRDPDQDLDCGNSGTSARLLAGIVAGSGRVARFTGDASLSRRPMRRVAEPLEQMGASITFEGGDGLPMIVRGGPLRPVDWTSRSASAQVKSAILLAAVSGRVAATVHEPARSRDHTERMLGALGVSVHVDGTSVHVDAADGSLPPLDFDVPGDPSSAAFFAAWALLTGRSVRTSVISTNPTRTGFLDALVRVGAVVEVDDAGLRCGEPVGLVQVSGAIERPFTIVHDDVPALVDELPLIACLAASVPGESRVTGAAELRVKESDRIATVVSNLRAIGADADELPDGFVVHGHTRPLRGRVTTHGDHRIAMAFGVLGAVPGNEIAVDDPACVAVSFPGFWATLADLTS